MVCPWHGSEFALEDGRVINGPATQSQPCLDVREHAGQIEVKGREAHLDTIHEIHLDGHEGIGARV